MKKFWNKTENEIYIYGDIVSEKWADEDVTAKSFLEELRSFNGKDVTVHINSAGGDVYTAIAIGNVIRNYKGDVTVMIDGICASAATLIACSASTVEMADNAIYMIHLPSTMLLGFCDEVELTKALDALMSVKKTVVQTYENRLKNKEVDIEGLMKAETYLTATEAVEYGFVDKIAEKSDATFDNSSRMMFVNKVELDLGRLNGDKLKEAVARSGMGVSHLNQTNNAVMAERARISELLSKQSDNAAVNKIINLAIRDGKSYSEIKEYIDAVKEVKSAGAMEFSMLIKDQLKSGAEGVNQNPPQDKAQEALNRLVKMANGLV